jgi:prephenate dehydrogenase
VLAAPVREHRAAVRLDDHVRQAAVITDTGHEARDRRGSARFTSAVHVCGGHPLGGAAKGGLEHARPDLFKGRPWLLTPSGDRAGIGRRAVVGDCPRALGAELRIVDAGTRAAARVSQSSAAAHGERVDGDRRRCGRKDGLSLAGRGLADSTRLASALPRSGETFAATTADELGPALDALRALL